MKKVAIVAFGAICAPVFLATSALAGSDLTPPEVGGEVVGKVVGNVADPGAGAGALAFTGGASDFDAGPASARVVPESSSAP